MAAPQQPQIPGYEPVRLLGINLGTVYLSRHSNTGALVALKVFRCEDAQHVRDLHAPLARLDHPNIIRLFGMGDFEKLFWCALEYVETTLADRLLRGPLPEAEVAEVTRNIAFALQYARTRGMRPLGLSPKAILLSEENVPKLIDFCPVDVPATLPVRTLPSPFMAPEELSGVITAATDVYRLGAVVYAMLTGKPPFGDDGDMVATAVAVVTERPIPPRRLNAAVGNDLEVVCMKCLEKRPEDRYASAEELISDLPSFSAQLT